MLFAIFRARRQEKGLKKGFLLIYNIKYSNIFYRNNSSKAQKVERDDLLNSIGSNCEIRLRQESVSRSHEAEFQRKYSEFLMENISTTFY